MRLKIPLILGIRYDLLDQFYHWRWISFQDHLTENTYAIINRQVWVQSPENSLDNQLYLPEFRLLLIFRWVEITDSNAN